MRNGWIPVLFALAATPFAAETTAWFGTPLPQAPSDPRKPVMDSSAPRASTRSSSNRPIRRRRR